MFGAPILSTMSSKCTVRKSMLKQVEAFGTLECICAAENIIMPPTGQIRWICGSIWIGSTARGNGRKSSLTNLTTFSPRYSLFQG